MSARALLNIVEGWLIESHGEDAVYDMLHPPTAEEQKQERLAQLRALGVAVQVA